MKKFNVLLSLLLVLCLAAGICLTAFADNYTYTLSFSAGNQGTFTGAGIYVSNPNAKVSVSDSQVIVSGLNLNDVVSFQMDAVQLDWNSKYYVRGIRMAGRDNNTVSNSAFRVTKDQDYVVAYGIRGQMTEYTVKYQNEAGEDLIPSRTFAGNVGDKPVVAFVYIEGYLPQTYNITKTLTGNPEEDVFVFTYIPADIDEPTEPSTEPTEPVPGTEPTAPVETEPTEPLDLMDIDEGPGPLGKGFAELVKKIKESGYAGLGLGIAGLCLLLLILLLVKRRKKDDKAEEKKNSQENQKDEENDKKGKEKG